MASGAYFVGSGIPVHLWPLPPILGGPVVTRILTQDAKEVLGGYWMIQVRSREEAIEWAKRCPGGRNEIVEVRQVQEMSDFPADVQKAAEGFERIQGAAARKEMA